MNKIKYTIVFILVIAMIISNPLKVFAASYRESFDSFTAGNSIYTEDSTHWSDAGGSGSSLIVNDVDPPSSPNALRVFGNLTETALLTLTGTEIIDSNRVVSFYYRRSSALGAGNVTMFWRNGATAIFATGGDTQGMYINGGSLESAGTFSSGIWYLFEVDIDFTNHRARLRVDGGTYTSFVAFNSNVSSLDKLAITPETGFDEYIDDLFLGVATPPVSSKSIESDWIDFE